MNTIWNLAPDRIPYPPEKKKPAYAGHAPHLRGRVRKSGRLWLMEVINHHTGQIIASDNCIVWDTSINGTTQMTAAARGAWAHRYRQKDLK